MFLYFSESDFTICGFSTAIEPIIKLFIPRSKYLSARTSDLIPPPNWIGIEIEFLIFFIEEIFISGREKAASKSTI